MNKLNYTELIQSTKYNCLLVLSLILSRIKLYVWWKENEKRNIPTKAKYKFYFEYDQNNYTSFCFLEFDKSSRWKLNLSFYQGFYFKYILKIVNKNCIVPHRNQLLVCNSVLNSLHVCCITLCEHGHPILCFRVIHLLKMMTITVLDFNLISMLEAPLQAHMPIYMNIQNISR